MVDEKIASRDFADEEADTFTAYSRVHLLLTQHAVEIATLITPEHEYVTGPLCVTQHHKHDDAYTITSNFSTMPSIAAKLSCIQLGDRVEHDSTSRCEDTLSSKRSFTCR